MDAGKMDHNNHQSITSRVSLPGLKVDGSYDVMIPLVAAGSRGNLGPDTLPHCVQSSVCLRILDLCPRVWVRGCFVLWLVLAPAPRPPLGSRLQLMRSKTAHLHMG